MLRPGFLFYVCLGSIHFHRTDLNLFYNNNNNNNNNLAYKASAYGSRVGWTRARRNNNSNNLAYRAPKCRKTDGQEMSCTLNWFKSGGM